MKPVVTPWKLTASLVLGGLAIPLSVSAQIIPDSTLPNNSLINIEGSIQRVTGGTEAGNNLFHSFREFNVSTGETAFFDNAPSIENIITRVTGGQFSNIDGILRANGSANLFLLNPNGMAFGPNAQLDIGGSFLGSTAESLLFEDGTAFSATNPESGAGTGALPLLSVNVPIGLQFGASPGSIVHRSQAVQVGADGEETIVGLQVLPERTLALVGGEVRLEGGYLTSAAGTIDLGTVGATLVDNDGNPIDVEQVSGGRIEVGAVGGNSQVAIESSSTQTFALNYEGAGNFQDIQLSQLALIDASGDGGGEIQIQGRRVTIKEGAIVRSNTLGANPGGTLTLRGNESVEVLGNTLTDVIEPRLAGAGILVPRRTSVSTTSFAQGRAGNLTIETGKLILTDGAEVAAFSFGQGRGGDVFIRASESVELYNRAIILGFDPESLTSFGFDVPGFDIISWRYRPTVTIIAASSVGNGPAGNTSIDTGRLILRNGGTVAANAFFGGDAGTVTVNASDSIEVFGTSEEGIARSFLWSGSTGSGEAGDVVLNTGRLTIGGGANVMVVTLSTGGAGNISIDASESVEVSGRTGDGQIPSTISASTFGEGNAGNLRINTGELVVRDRAEVSVSGTQFSNAGNLNVSADTIRLENGLLTAQTAAGAGGNLTLRTSDLQLRRGSSLNTNAGNTDGGNIDIDTDTLVALENSDITANALQGRGGQVSIAARGIFGTQFRDRLTPESDITATSELGAEFSGTVTITNPDVDATAGLVTLSSETTDPSDRIISGCATGSSFTVTGRGGLTEEPMSMIRGETVWEDWRNHAGDYVALESPSQPVRVTPLTPPHQLVEATGWVVRDNGTVELIAEQPGMPMPWSKAAECNG